MIGRHKICQGGSAGTTAGRLNIAHLNFHARVISIFFIEGYGFSGVQLSRAAVQSFDQKQQVVEIHVRTARRGIFILESQDPLVGIIRRSASDQMRIRVPDSYLQ